jgi:hypothetical protein
LVLGGYPSSVVNGVLGFLIRDYPRKSAVRSSPNKTARSFRLGQFQVSNIKCFYFFRRLIKPVTSEPKPSRPSRGSGEAVWGSFCPAFAFWSLEEAL